MAQEFRLPDLGEGLTEGEIARWLVSEGDEVAEDAGLVEIQTDKATVEIPSPYAGTVLRILVAEGEVAPVGAPLVLIGAPGEAEELTEGAPESPSDDKSQSPQQEVVQEALARVQATPLVRRIAQELGVELSSVQGTGPNGRITEDDVRSAVASRRQPEGLVTDRHKEEGRKVPLRGVRRLIAEHMTRAQAVPAVTWVEECDFGNVELELLVATVIKACASALPDFPELNARFEDDAIVYLDRYDIGVAVQTEQGLVVPVVRGCDGKTVAEIDAEVRRYAEGARAGALRADELRGSTFTVTSAGKVAGLFQTPLVNHPEVGILSVGRIAPRPVVRDGDVVVSSIGHVALTFDHRVVDGARAAEFGLAVIERLESGHV
jgi:pyruvate dehydrogenase E2 component (dihydrolipoamide acetyltransferase)